MRPGDVLLAIDGQPVEGRGRRARVAAAARSPAIATPTRCSGSGSREVAQRVSWRRCRAAPACFYYVLAARRHLHAARRRGGARAPARPIRRRCISSGCRSRSSACSRSRSAAASIASTGSSTGPTSIALLLLPPLFLHFALVFPERPHHAGLRGACSRAGCRRSTCRPRCSARRACWRWCAPAIDPDYFVRLIALLDRLEMLYLAVVPRGRPRRAAARAVARALGDRASASCAGLSGARRSARCRSRSATRCRSRSASIRRCRWSCRPIPLGFIPLAFASAIVRYRLMDVEIILKRLLVYTSAVAAIVAIYVADPARLRRLVHRRARPSIAGSSRSSPPSS